MVSLHRQGGSWCRVKKKGKLVMETDDNLTVERSASLLGVNPFSLLSRVQTGEIKMTRARSGELLIPASELERLCPDVLKTQSVDSGTESLPISDEELGIKKSFGGLKRNGEYPARFTVPGYEGQFTARETESYRAAFSVIANQHKSLAGFKRQLDREGARPSEKEFDTPQTGRWLVRCRLLNLGQSEILLCQRADYDFAIIERFRADSVYAKANGSAEILMKGNRVRQLTEDFKANAQHTLEFLASNLTAKAQKVVWEQFPDDRPGHVVSAISERCRQAVTNEETISQNQRKAHSVSRGVSI